MSIIAQCGHAEGNKVTAALNAGVIDGVILSPRHHSVPNLRAQATAVLAQGGANYVLFDPQFYASVIASGAAKLGKLQTYPYYPSQQGLRRVHFGSSEIRLYARGVLDFQAQELASQLSHYIAPTVLLDSLDDFWSQIALNLASEAIEYNKALKPSKPLLISLFATEGAFTNRRSVEDFVDAVTSYDAAGFYVVVNRGLSRAECALKPTPLGHLMYTCYVLSKLNEYLVICGYEDLEGMLLHAAGVTACATGWTRGIRAFNLENLYVQTGKPGGISPRARYTSAPLLSKLKLTPEIRDIDKAGHLAQILSGGAYDVQLQSALGGSLASWDRTTEALQHWHVLQSLATAATQSSDLQGRLKAVSGLISNASKRHGGLQGVTIGLASAHLDKWVDAVNTFQGTLKP